MNTKKIVELIENIPSTKQDLKDFGFVMGVASTVFGLYLLAEDNNFALRLIQFGVFIQVVGLICPQVLMVFQKVWLLLAYFMGWLMTRLLLMLIFYTIITPMGLFLKIMGKDILDVGLDASVKSYWIPRSKRISKKIIKNSYEKQF